MERSLSKYTLFHALFVSEDANAKKGMVVKNGAGKETVGH